MDNVQRVAKAAERIRLKRAELLAAEVKLQEAVVALINVKGDSLRAWAKSMGITVAYACDIRHGRRKISEAMVAKILGSKVEGAK